MITSLLMILVMPVLPMMIAKVMTAIENEPVSPDNTEINVEVWSVDNGIIHGSITCQ